MRISLARLSLICFAFLFPGACFAQSNTFTQVGTWQCTVPPAGGAPLGPYACPRVTFPQQFGATPSIVSIACWSYNGVGHGSGCDASGGAVTAPDSTGFTPQGYCCGARGTTTYSGSWIATGPVLLYGTAVAKYIVLTVVYAPPGTNGGHSTSSVSYSAGSTTGTTTSASQSFKVSNSLSFEASGGFLGNGGGGGLSFGFSNDTTDTQSLDIKKSLNSNIGRNGPSQDGINHDEDAIYLLLNPTVNLSVSSSSASWLLANSSSPIQYVYVGWLNGHTPMPPNIATVLGSAGITSSDYPVILARDPLASGGTIDPNRFVPLNTTFPYEPPYASTDPVPVITTTISDASTQTTTSEVTDTYTVGLTLSSTGSILDFEKDTLKDTASWEWTNKSTQSSSAESAQTASVTIGGPAFGYTGPTVLEVYEDQIYHTFAFNLEPLALEEIGLTGTVTGSDGMPIGNREVVLTSKRRTYRTFTDARGQYTFIGNITGPVTVQCAGQNTSVNQTGAARKLDIKLP